MRRRVFLVGLGGLVIGCDGRIWSEPGRTADAGAPPVGFDAGVPTAGDAGPGFDAGAPLPGVADAGAPDAGAVIASDAGCPMARTVVLHDTHAQALYFDGTHGPTTGVITVDEIVAGAALDKVFWHGHGGRDHQFTVTAEHLAALTRGERVTLMTSEVEGHAHMLFIDPRDDRWRVSGAPDRQVTIC